MSRGRKKNSAGLTEHQRAVLEWIRKYRDEKGVSPTIRDIGREFDIKPPTVLYVLRTLQKKGFIHREKNRARSIVVVDSRGDGSRRMVEIPVVGRVVAGEPVVSYENVTGTIQVPSGYNRRLGGRVFALRVTGDSMVGAGILDGDILLVRHSPEADNNDIIVAMLDGEVTVKRLKKKGDVIWLIPENDKMSPIKVTEQNEFQVLGKVMALYREFDGSTGTTVS